MLLVKRRICFSLTLYGLIRSMLAQEKALNVRFAFWVNVREHPVQLAGVFKEHFMLWGEYMALGGD